MTAAIQMPRHSMFEHTRGRLTAIDTSHKVKYALNKVKKKQ